MLQTLYTLLFYLIQPLIWLRLWIRGRKAPEYRRRWFERYGLFLGPIKPGGILLHSVSVGETIAAIPLIKRLQQQYPELPITVTTMTVTGSEQVKKTFGNTVNHVYLPYDLPAAMRLFLNQVRPRLMIIMETELWPNLITLLHQRRIPLVIANARLSERSARGYRKLGRFMHRLLPKITLIAAQDAEAKARFIRLGAIPEQISVTGSLKFDIAIPPQLAAQAQSLRQQWAPARPVWIAASTHEGEEALLLDAHRQLLIRLPKLLLIIVPRHPERFATVRKLAQKKGFQTLLRSSGENPSPATQVVIGDTMGELMLLYGVADLAFVGGSLIEHGGHNPLEPAAQGIPILTGPHTFNFNAVNQQLTQAGGLISINDNQALVLTITNLLSNDAERIHCGQQALAVLQKNQGALQKLLALLAPYLAATYPIRSD